MAENMTEKSRYLDYLPAIYHDDPYVGQFLMPFEDVLEGFRYLLDDIDRYFAPALTDQAFLPWLATWVALVLDEEWDDAKRRRLIGEAVQLYRWRGTVYGLKRYLEIYTGLVPEIREWRWPGGMQIGVASRIGGFSSAEGSAPLRVPPTRTPPVNARIQRVERSDPAYYDYYVVDTQFPDGKPLRLYYRTDRVKRVEVSDGRVELWLFPAEGEVAEKKTHEPATITRRDGLIDDVYTLDVKIGEDPVTTLQYHGDTYLVDEVEEDRPYHFIVDVRVPAEDIGSVKIDKVRAIVDLEKPAHTVYYLKLTPVVMEYKLKAMQIKVRSTIGLDTVIG
jgi:phage tail-like protein